MFRSVLVVARRRLAITIAAVLAVSMLGVVGSTNAWAGGTRPVSGTYASLTVVTGDACTSPIGLCTAGTLGGSIQGRYSFAATSVIQSVDTPTTGVEFLTGDLVVDTNRGQFTCKEAAAFAPVSGGPISSICTFVSGTGVYAGVTGHLQFTGSGTSLSGSGGGNYVGTLVFP